MASITCAHCKDTHASVSEVRECAYNEYEAEAESLAEYRAEYGYGYSREVESFQEAAQEDCVHGLSAWLCADPINHYPADHETF